MQANYISRSVLLAALFLLASGNAISESKTTPRVVPATLTAAIQKAYPGTKILDKSDLDKKSCGELRDDPGFLAADFNGDGLTDYAVVLHTLMPKKEENWEGVILKLHDFTVAVFVGKPGGGFQPVTLEQRETFIPSGFIIQKQAPGTLREWGTENDVQISRPGILLVSCEQFARVYYWKQKRFVAVQVSS